MTVGGSSVSETDTARGVTGEDEVVDLCRELIQIDTSNYGDHSGPGERKAAEYVAEKLAEVGLDPQIFESHPGRASPRRVVSPRAYRGGQLSQPSRARTPWCVRSGRRAVRRDRRCGRRSHCAQKP